MGDNEDNNIEENDDKDDQDMPEEEIIRGVLVKKREYREDYEVEEEIGKGVYAHVYKVKKLRPDNNFNTNPNQSNTSVAQMDEDDQYFLGEGIIPEPPNGRRVMDISAAIIQFDPDEISDENFAKTLPTNPYNQQYNLDENINNYEPIYNNDDNYEDEEGEEGIEMENNELENGEIDHAETPDIEDEYYAAKVFTKRHAKNVLAKHSLEKINNLIYDEARIIRLFDHPTILHLYDVYDTYDYTALILELCEGDLATFLQLPDKPYDRENIKDFENIAPNVPETQILIYIRQIALGIQHIHQHNVVHSDLKFENVLMCNNVIKLSDFGLAKELKPGQFLNTNTGSPYYMAPEIMLGRVYSYPVDIWALGVCLYFALHNGVMPFDYSVTSKLPKLPALRQAIIGNVPVISNKITYKTRDLLLGMLIKKADQRFTIHEVLAHPAFNEGTDYYIPNIISYAVNGMTVKATTQVPSNFGDGNDLVFNIIGPKLPENTIIYAVIGGSFLDFVNGKIFPFATNEEADRYYRTCSRAFRLTILL